MKNFEAARQFVEYGLAEQTAGRRESASGPGSSLKAAEPTVWILDNVVPSLGVYSILDLGCGDWHWMKNTSMARKLCEVNSPYSYEGWEAHSGLVSQLQTEFGNERTHFRLADIVETPFPNVDLILARDVLFHLSPSSVDRVLRKARYSANFLLANSFSEVTEPYQPHEYLAIGGWTFGPLNLESERFGVSKSLFLSIEEKEARHRQARRFLNLYDLRR